MNYRQRFLARRARTSFALMSAFLLLFAAAAFIQSGGKALVRSSYQPDYVTQVIPLWPMLVGVAVLLALTATITFVGVKREVDLSGLLHPIVTAMGIGMVIQFYVGRGEAGGISHAAALCMALGLMAAAAVLFQVHPGRTVCFAGFLVVIGLSVATLLLGDQVNGARIWLDLGPISIQTGELLKTLLLALYVFSIPYLYGRDWVFQVAYIAAGLTAVVCLVLGHDWGNAIILYAMLIFTLMVQHKALGLALAGMSAAGLAAAAAWVVHTGGVLGNRVSMAFHVLSRPEEEGFWQLRRVLLSALRGGFLGTGTDGSAYTRISYIAQADCDYIILVAIGVFGVALAAVYVASLLLFAWNCIREDSGTSKEQLIRRVVAFGLLLQLAIAVAAELNLCPFVGVNAALLSRGNSNLLSVSLMIGMALATQFPKVQAVHEAVKRVDVATQYMKEAIYEEDDEDDEDEDEV